MQLSISPYETKKLFILGGFGSNEKVRNECTLTFHFDKEGITTYQYNLVYNSKPHGVLTGFES